MSDRDEPGFTQEALFALVKSMEARLLRLEDGGKKSWLKRATENAGAVALFLGIVLTFASLYDVFVSEPEADRLNRVSQFNQLVNSAAKTRQELTQAASSSPQVQFAMGSWATPRILNDIATARTILPSLADEDVGVPQLVVLIGEAFTVGDLASAEAFIQRAVGKKDVTPYLHSEAKRYQGRFLFVTGRPPEARAAFEEASKALGDSSPAAGARAHVLGDWAVLEYTYGECDSAVDVIRRFAVAVSMPGVAAGLRTQLTAVLRDQLEQWGGRRCPPVKDVDAILGLSPGGPGAPAVAEAR